MRKASVFQALAIILLVLLPLASVFIFAYIHYSDSDDRFIAERDYRRLALLSSQVAGELNGRSYVVITNGQFEFAESFNIGSRKGYGIGELNASLARSDLQLDEPILGLHAAAWPEENPLSLLIEPPSPGQSLTAHYLYVGACDPSFEREFNFKKAKCPVIDTPLPCKSKQSFFLKGRISDVFCVKTDLGQIIRYLATDPSGWIVFDTLLLVDPTNGRVLYQTSYDGGLIANVNALVDPEAQAESETVGGSLASQTQSPLSSAHQTVASPEASHIFSPSHYDRVRYANDQYLLFAAPIKEKFILRDNSSETLGSVAPSRVQAGAASSTLNNPARPGTRDSLVLVGLVSAQRFETETQATASPWLTKILIFLTLGILIWPFLRLHYLSPNEWISALDVRILIVSYLALVFVSIFILLDLPSLTS